jgi:DNA/RNA endonuclease G (NUC1)
MFRIAAIWIVLLVGTLLSFAGGPADPEDCALEDFAPTADFVVLHRGQIVGRPDFTGLPTWALEEVAVDDLDGPGDRNKSHWHKDPSTLPERPIGDDDYLHSERSKGHLNAAGCHTATQDAIDATHSYFNCVPQEQAMNAQVWERTEQRKRDLRANGAKVRSTTVRVFQLKAAGKTAGGCPLWSIDIIAQGPHQAWRPTHLATSIRAQRNGHVWLENYLIPNTADVAGDDIKDHRVTCDEIERLTNLNLWPAPPQLKGKARERWLQQQEELEAQR